MQRDFDLIRRILLAVRDLPAGESKIHFRLEDVPQREVAEHVELLIEAGLIRGAVRHLIDGEEPLVKVDRLTWAGHDFIDAAGASVWKQATERLKRSGSTITFEVLLELLKSLGRAQVGL